MAEGGTRLHWPAEGRRPSPWRTAGHGHRPKPTPGTTRSGPSPGRSSPAVKPASPPAAAGKSGASKSSPGLRLPVAYKANLGRRIGAAFIDAFLATLAGTVFLVWNWWPVTAILVAAYLLVRDGLGIPALDGQSVGKKLAGLHVELRQTGRTGIDLPTSVKRNATLAGGFLLMIPVGMLSGVLALLVAIGPLVAELVLIHRHPEGLRYGDQIGGTKVLD